MPPLPRDPDDFTDNLTPAPSSADTSSPCTICMDTYDGSHRAVQLPCSHVFGRNCISEWANSRAENSNACPICRAPLYDDGRPTAQERQEDADQAVRMVRDYDAFESELPGRLGGARVYGGGFFFPSRSGPGDFSRTGPRSPPSPGFMNYGRGDLMGSLVEDFFGGTFPVHHEVRSTADGGRRGRHQVHRSVQVHDDDDENYDSSDDDEDYDSSDSYDDTRNHPIPSRPPQRGQIRSPSPLYNQGHTPAHRAIPPLHRGPLRSGRPDRDALARAALSREPQGRASAAADRAANSARERQERERAALSRTREHERQIAARERQEAIMRPPGQTITDYARRLGTLSLNDSSPPPLRSRDRGPAAAGRDTGTNRMTANSSDASSDTLWTDLTSHALGPDFFSTLWATIHTRDRPRYEQANMTLTSRTQVSLLRTLEGVLKHYRDRNPDTSMFAAYYDLVRAARIRAADNGGGDVAPAADPRNWVIRHLIKLICTMCKVSVVLPLSAIDNAALFAQIVDRVQDQPFDWRTLNRAVERLDTALAPLLQMLALMLMVASPPELARRLGSANFRGQPSGTLLRRAVNMRRCFQGLGQAEAFRGVNGRGARIAQVFFD
ncbi:hypothetical protein P280DRAFT_506639 [Massarina eburnea CBS 473.64]|uniref:RING-type domain-containing protein n=1 Tax=Massarina eburnea CBS 473.64 TaxID=1395130 RepID=A0A6A6S3T1_9PLEO|nr:hypothetical protein P280DRAFT_506639 [Massarina eburnea CBS 473.64]